MIFGSCTFTHEDSGSERCKIPSIGTAQECSVTLDASDLPVITGIDAGMRIGIPRRTKTSDGSTAVMAEVDGDPIWFSSKDIVLSDNAEVFASALLIPAACTGEDLIVDAPLDASWHQNSRSIQRLLREWWKFPGTKIVAPQVKRASDSKPNYSAQCFTGGVDSYYELIEASPPPNALMFVQGYDIPRQDHVRLAAFLPGFQETAKAYGAEAILITSNLREHPSMRKCSWEKSHGGALAAAGHLLADQITDLTIPSSYPYHDPKPWGSHWDLDPLWSSAAVRIRHGDATYRRNGKVRAIASNDLVRRHVRVCHENRARTGNCSRCEKCIRTMIAFANVGLLERCEAFDHRVPLSKRVARLNSVGPHLISILEEMAQEITDSGLSRAVEDLIRRSRRPRTGYRRTLANWHDSVREKLGG